MHFRAQIAKVLRNDGKRRKPRAHSVNEIHARPFDPMAMGGSCFPKRNAPIAFQPPEMVDAQHVVQARCTCDALHPPAVTIFPHLFPAIKRVSPKLAVRAEGIRRHTGHGNGRVTGVQLKILRSRPNIRRIHGYIDRQVSDDFDAMR